MRASSRSFIVDSAAGWVDTIRLALPFLLSGLSLTAAPPTVAQTPTATPAAHTVPVAPIERMPLDDPFTAPITEAARRFRLPAELIRAVLRLESGGDPQARSPKGAQGLMQIMPKTWADLRRRHALGKDPFNPRDSILAGAAYLRELLDHYGSPGFLAAYNAGPARYENYLAGRPLPDETRAILAALRPLLVTNDPTADSAIIGIITARSWTSAPLFVVQANRTPAAVPVQPGRPSSDTPMAGPVRDLSVLQPHSDGLFVALSRAAPPDDRARTLARPVGLSERNGGQAGEAEDHDNRTAR
jgi:hypothetical protein